MSLALPGGAMTGSTLTVKQQQKKFEEQKKLNPDIVFSRPN